MNLIQDHHPPSLEYLQITKHQVLKAQVAGQRCHGNLAAAVETN